MEVKDSGLKHMEYQANDTLVLKIDTNKLTTDDNGMAKFEIPELKDDQIEYKELFKIFVLGEKTKKKPIGKSWPNK